MKLCVYLLCISTWGAELESVLPGVHQVRSDERYVYVESAGLSLDSFGPLEANQYETPSGVRHFSFRFPREPKAATGATPSTPLGVIGAFVTGVPIYNAVGSLSYRDQNIWHVDAVAMADDGTATATGRPVPGHHGNGTPPLLQATVRGNGRHSALIGYALDGYPVYGPYGWGADGRVVRVRSGYRLRRDLTRRETLPDGTLLTPAQTGPDVSDEFPLGIFAEDYEYVAGLGDLDASNGRFAKTPEYPNGTYAYFLTTDGEKLVWPYLVGPSYHGSIDNQSNETTRHTGSQPHVSLFTASRVQSGEATKLWLRFTDAAGRPVRFLEKVHQQPVHLIVVSKDLNSFDHIHPELSDGDTFTVTHTFLAGGEYTLFADYTAPGESPSIARFVLNVEGPPAAATPQKAPTNITMSTSQRIQVGRDIEFRFKVGSDIEPWLGSWAHILMISPDRTQFIHAHPVDDLVTPATTPWQHSHAGMDGPGPSVIRTVTGFSKPGLYKVWLQFQRAGNLVTTPWIIRVAPAVPVKRATQPPAAAIQVKVSAAGYSPSRIEISAQKPTRISFTRTDAQNCANEVVFADMNIRKKLPVGQTVTIELPAMSPRVLRFACGMGMHQGEVMIR